MFRDTLKATFCVVTLTGIATPAFALDPFSEAVALTDGYSKTIEQSAFVKLSESIDMADAINIDTAITAKFGDPVIRRDGIKVWEIDNPDNVNNTANKVTITCGVSEGKIQISIDARAPSAAPIKAQSNAIKTQSLASRKTRASLRSKTSKSRTKSGLQLRPGKSDR